MRSVILNWILHEKKNFFLFDQGILGTLMDEEYGTYGTYVNIYLHKDMEPEHR